MLHNYDQIYHPQKIQFLIFVPATKIFITLPIYSKKYLLCNITLVLASLAGELEVHPHLPPDHQN